MAFLSAVSTARSPFTSQLSMNLSAMATSLSSTIPLASRSAICISAGSYSTFWYASVIKSIIRSRSRSSTLPSPSISVLRYTPAWFMNIVMSRLSTVPSPLRSEFSSTLLSTLTLKSLERSLHTPPASCSLMMPSPSVSSYSLLSISSDFIRSFSSITPSGPAYLSVKVLYCPTRSTFTISLGVICWTL